jgi:hypothetical protein
MSKAKTKKGIRKDKEHGGKARAKVKAKGRHDKRLAELTSHNHVKKTKQNETPITIHLRIPREVSMQMP